MNDQIRIRRAESVADYRACQDAQRRAWGIEDDELIVPIATLIGAQLHGGLVLGAFLADGAAVALSFAFLGRVEGRPCLYSQLTGVVPGYQARGLGLRLKQVQWEYAKVQGLDLLAWAFDPLQAGNAHFNLNKLGASAGRYVDDMYGVRTDLLNTGTPTDRLIAEWSTTSSSEPGPSLEIDEARALPPILRATPGPDGLLAAGPVEPPSGVYRVTLEIPDDIAALRMRDENEAHRWRLAVRRAFHTAFAQDYRAVAFVRFEAEGHRRCVYVLRRGGPGPD